MRPQVSPHKYTKDNVVSGSHCRGLPEDQMKVKDSYVKSIAVKPQEKCHQRSIRNAQDHSVEDIKTQWNLPGKERFQ